MWLLKLHIAISILCLLTFYGFKYVFEEVLKQNGYLPSEKKTKAGPWAFFIPILNVTMICIFLVMLTMPKNEFDKWCEDHKKSKEE